MEFQSIYKAYYPKILGYLTRTLNDREVAEDLSQDVFIRVNEGLSNFEGRASLSTWIYKIATNIACDYFKSASFRIGKKQAISGENIDERKEDMNVWTGDKSKTSDQVMEKKEMNDCIKRYVNEIPEIYRAVFILSEYEGLKNKEIAEILGLTLDTVKIRIFRARSQLKKKMKEGCRIDYDENGISCDEI
jgi:RNA polymerase sigma-70 factor (ECF subfamily)